MSPATAVLFRFPQPARANQSGLCLEHHPSPSHNLPRHGDPFHRCLSGILAWQDCLEPVSNRFLTDALAGLRHGNPAHKYSSDISAWRRGLLAGLRHGDSTHRYLSGITAWRMASRPVHDRQLTDALTGLRHGDPPHRYLRGITAWQSVLLTGFRHGDPAHRYFRGIPVWRSIFQATSNRFLSSIPVGPRHGAPSTGTSVASPRGEEGFYRHFGTATLPTGVSVASSRGKAFF